MELETLEVRIKGAPQAREAVKGLDGALRGLDGRLRDVRGRFVGAGKGAGDMGKKLRGARKDVLSLRGALASLGLMAIGQHVVKTIATFESLEASLHTITGSAVNASREMERMKKIAVETPFSVEGVTKAFIRLKAQGLDASTESLKAYGDLASSFHGKTIIDFVEAVADATQGQKKRLKEFGIGMAKEGGKVTLTFGSLKKTVQNDAKSIETALREIAQERFGGAMARQAATLGGQWAKLGDVIDQFIVKMGEAGLADALKGLVDFLSTTTEAGDGLAVTLGETLALAVDVFTGVLKFAVENAGLLVKAFKLFLTLKAAILFNDIATGVVAAARAFMTATGATNKATAAMTAFNLTNPVGWITIAVGLLYTFREEIEGVAQAWGDWLLQYESGLRRLAGFADSFGISGKQLLAAIDARNAQIKAAVENAQFLAATGGIGSDEYLLREKVPGSGEKPPGGEGVDKVAKAFRDLRIEAAAAQVALDYMNKGLTDDQLAVELAALEIKKGLIQEGIALTKTQKEELKVILAKKLALEKETEALKERKKAEEESLKGRTKFFEGLRDESLFEAEKLGLTAGGLDGKELAIQLKLMEKRDELQKLHKDGIIPPEELAAMESYVRAAFNAAEATDKLTRARDQATSVKTSLGDELAGAQGELALAQSGLSQKQLLVEQKLLEIRLANKDLTEAQVQGFRKLAESVVDVQMELENLKNSHSALKGFISTNQDLWGNLEAVGVGAINKLADVWAKFLSTGELSFKDFVKSTLAEINKIAFKFAATEGLKALFPSIAASVFHQGGEVGGPAPSRQVSPFLFAGAPRLHSGLRADEYPAILQRGEEVTSKRDVRRRGRGEGRVYAPSINVQIIAPNPNAFRGSEREIMGTLGRAQALAMREMEGGL